MSEAIVYLAGAAEAKDSWREKAAKKLEKIGFRSLNPMRGENLRKAKGGDGHVVSDVPAKAIVVRDHHDLQRVKDSGGWVLMNLNVSPEGREPLATFMELEWCYIFSVPVVAIMGSKCPRRIKEHPWVMELVAFKATSLTQALKMGEAFFSDAPAEESKVDDDDEEEA